MKHYNFYTMNLQDWVIGIFYKLLHSLIGLNPSIKPASIQIALSPDAECKTFDEAQPIYDSKIKDFPV